MSDMHRPVGIRQCGCNQYTFVIVTHLFIFFSGTKIETNHEAAKRNNFNLIAGNQERGGRPFLQLIIMHGKPNCPNYSLARPKIFLLLCLQVIKTASQNRENQNRGTPRSILILPVLYFSGVYAKNGDKWI
jgi:hypothetical protein